MTRLHNLYLGRSGQLAVMAEFLARGYNAAIPEVDRGDDIFVVKDDNGELSRIQVKTATATQHRRGASAKFKVSQKQLSRATRPDLNFVLAIRMDERWQDFILISRAKLYEEHEVNGAGTLLQGDIVFTLALSEAKVTCSGQDWTNFRNNWSPWPIIVH